MKVRPWIRNLLLATIALAGWVLIKGHFQRFEIVDVTKEQTLLISDRAKISSHLSVHVVGELDGSASFALVNKGVLSEIAYKNVSAGPVDITLSLEATSWTQALTFSPSTVKSGKLKISYSWG